MVRIHMEDRQFRYGYVSFQGGPTWTFNALGKFLQPGVATKSGEEQTTSKYAS